MPAQRNSASTCRRPTVLDPRTSELCDKFAEQYARAAPAQGRDGRACPRDHPRRLVFRHHAGVQRHGRRHGVGCRPHHRPHRAAGVRDHQDPARRLDRVEHLLDVPGRSGAGLRRLRDRAGPDVGAVGRHRDLLGTHGRAVRHRAAGGDAVLLHRNVGHRRRRRKGPDGNRTGAQTPTRTVGGRAHSVRRGRRTVGRGQQDARVAGSRARDGADLPRPQHRQQHLQGGAAQRRRHRDRTGAAGPEQAGQRPVPGGFRGRHRQHGGDHRDPGAGEL